MSGGLGAVDSSGPRVESAAPSASVMPASAPRTQPAGALVYFCRNCCMESTEPFCGTCGATLTPLTAEEAFAPITECACGESFDGPLDEGAKWFLAHRNQEHPDAVPRGYRPYLRVVRDQEAEETR